MGDVFRQAHDAVGVGTHYVSRWPLLRNGNPFFMEPAWAQMKYFSTCKVPADAASMAGDLPELDRRSKGSKSLTRWQYAFTVCIKVHRKS